MTKKSLIKSAVTIFLTIALIVGMMPSAAHASAIPSQIIPTRSLDAPNPPSTYG